MDELNWGQRLGMTGNVRDSSGKVMLSRMFAQWNRAINFQQGKPSPAEHCYERLENIPILSRCVLMKCSSFLGASMEVSLRKALFYTLEWWILSI